MGVTEIPSELEVKLLASGESTLRGIARRRAIDGYALVPQRPVRLHTLYLDTADLTLARQNVALRVRRCARRWEATIKWEGTSEGELHERPELTVELRGRPRPPFVIKDPQLRDMLAARVAGRPLQVIVVTDVRRSRLHVFGDNNEKPLAEICLDRVHLHGGQDGSPEERYYEVEIERVDGDLTVLREVAAHLRDAFGLVPSKESKLVRGLAMLGYGDSLRPLRTTLVPGDTVDSAARKVVWQQLSALRQHDPGVRRGEDPEALHDMRVATRRLRASLSTFRQAFSVGERSHLRAELKWLGQTLGGVRDMDVQLQRLASFNASAPATLRKSLQKYVRFLERRRAQHRKQMLAALWSPRYFALLVRLENYAIGTAGDPPDEAWRPVGELGAEEIENAYRRLRKRGEKVKADPTPEGLHDLRIRAKRLRYALEFCRDLIGREGSKVIRRLTRLQDLLGDLHDAVVAADLVRQYVEGPGRAAGATGLITMSALLAQQLQRADELRLNFERTWKRFERRRTRRGVEGVIRRLRKQSLCLERTPAHPPLADGAHSGAESRATETGDATDSPQAMPNVLEQETCGPLEDRHPPARHDLRPDDESHRQAREEGGRRR